MPLNHGPQLLLECTANRSKCLTVLELESEFNRFIDGDEDRFSPC